MMRSDLEWRDEINSPTLPLVRAFHHSSRNEARTLPLYTGQLGSCGALDLTDFQDLDISALCHVGSISCLCCVLGKQ